MESPEKDRKNKIHNVENPAAFLKCSGVFIWFGKKRGRKEEKVQRLTASAVFHEFRIYDKYVNTMTDSVRICELHINESLKLDALWECLLTHDAPHLINVGQRIEVLVIVIVEGTLQSHMVHTIRFCYKAKLFGQP